MVLVVVVVLVSCQDFAKRHYNYWQLNTTDQSTVQGMKVLDDWIEQSPVRHQLNLRNRVY